MGVNRVSFEGATVAKLAPVCGSGDVIGCQAGYVGVTPENSVSLVKPAPSVGFGPGGMA